MLDHPSAAMKAGAGPGASAYPENWKAGNHRPLPDFASGHLPELAHKPALTCNGREVSYAALEERANRVANGLLADVGTVQARVAFLDRNRPEYVELFLGAAKAKMVLVPLNSRLAASEIAHILRDAGAPILFVGPEFVDLVNGLRGELPGLEHIVVMGEGYDAWRDGQSDVAVRLPLVETDVCIQMYTSGTTGLPKGVELTHEGVARQVETCTYAWDNWMVDDVLLLGLPLFHIAGTGALLIALRSGMTIVLLEEFVPPVVLQDVERHRITLMIMVPAMIQALVSVPTTADLSSLRAIIYGAAPISPRVLADALAMFPTTKFHQIYGLTETSGPFTALAPADHLDPDSPRIASCGLPMPGMEVAIFDEDDQPLAARGIGEVVCRTPSIMKGYWKREDATADAIRDGWFHSGDIGYIDEDGYLFLCDRKNDMIVSGGENIYPAEVEAALSLHPSIEEVAVIGVPDARWGEAVMALVVPRGSLVPDPDEIIAFARTCLATFKVPKSVVVRGPLPRNPTGKVLRRHLREPYWEGLDRKIA